MFDLQQALPFAPLIGFISGLLIGSTGIGGAAFATPALVLGLGVPASMAIATDAVFCAVIKLLGLKQLKSHLGSGVKALKIALLGSVPGAALGAWAVAYLGSVPNGDAFLQKVLGVLLVFGAAFTLWQLFSQKEADSEEERKPRLPLVLLAPCSFVLGFFVGLTSIGAGSLFVPLLLLFVSAPFVTIVALSIAQGLILAVAVGALHFTVGNVSPALLLALIAGGVPGVLIGLKLHNWVSSKALVSTTAGIIVVVGLGLVI